MGNVISFGTEDHNKTLDQLGHEKSGLHKGDPGSLKQYLEAISENKYVPPTLSENSKKIIENEIEINKRKIVELTGLKNDLKNNQIPSLELEVKRIDEGIDTIPSNERFKISKFIVLIISWLLITGFLLYFYSSIAVNAFSKPFIKDSLHLLSIKEIWSTLTNSPGLFLVPSIFLALGVSLHYVLDKKGAIKWVLSGTIIAFTFILDFVIALYIHQRVNDHPLNKEKIEWSSDIKFWIIIFMGFLVYMLWSLVFHGWMEELGKRDLKGRLDVKREKLVSQITSLKSEESKFNSEIENLTNESDSKFKRLEFNLPTIQDKKRYMSEFGGGWLQYLHFDNQKPLREECQKIIEEIRTNCK